MPSETSRRAGIVNLFDRDISIFALGCCFKCDQPFSVEIIIEVDNKIHHLFHFESDQFEKIGWALEIQNSRLIDLNEVKLTSIKPSLTYLCITKGVDLESYLLGEGGRNKYDKDNPSVCLYDFIKQ